MSERSNLISKLQSDFKTRTAYIQAKVGTLVPSQIRALRTKSGTPRQPDLAQAAEMHQSRISMLETAGANPTIGTLSAIAAALNVGLKIEFVPFSEMLKWENCFSQDEFDVTRLANDQAFLHPQPVSPPHITIPLASSSQRALVAKLRAWRHSGIVPLDLAHGDFSTIWGGNVRLSDEVESEKPTLLYQYGFSFFEPQFHSAQRIIGNDRQAITTASTKS